MRAYFGSRISDHMIRTPEGYLVCKDVPIARTGIQNYRGMEFGGTDPNKIYNIERPEAEVFSKAALASFEGKPVVDEHPTEDVKPGNVLQYLKGTCRNVHRGEGALSDCIVADLIIYDDDLIRKIEDGKRDVSCGYDCLWDPKDRDTYVQREIRGNHVAVVNRGRAGHRVSIRDSKGGMKRMSTKKNSLWGRVLAAFAKDEDTTPEDLEAASKLNPKVQDEDPEPPKDPEPQRTPAYDALDARLRRIEDALDALAAEPEDGYEKPRSAEDDGEDYPDNPDDEPTALDALEGELTGERNPEGAEDDGEEDVPAEEINAAHGEETEDDADCIDPGDEDDDAKAARDAALDIIDGLKPVIAKLPYRQRQRAADSMAMLLRANLPDRQYAGLMRAKQNGHSARDSDPIMDDEEYGRMIRDKYNPHYKKD
nr:MAG TPA: hypothetical protein [Caudoviricetes sp.]